jgi:hypothetical protein
MKKWLLIIALCGLAGAALNYPVAWLFAMQPRRQQTLMTGGDTPPVMDLRTRLPPPWTGAAVDASPSSSNAAVVLATGTRRSFWVMSTVVRQTNDGRDSSIATGVRLTRDEAGWPCPALRSLSASLTLSNRRGQMIPVTISTGTWIAPRLPAWTGLSTAYPLPLQPVWPGFAVNGMLYTAIIVAPLAATSALLRRRSRRRGLCPRCAYNLAGLPPNSPCPECGRAPPTPHAPRPKPQV